VTAPDLTNIDPALLRRLAALAGVDLTDERADALVSQAEPHFALLRVLSAEDPATEPAAEFRLDTWTPRRD
jgi:hypothetical protein